MQSERQGLTLATAMVVFIATLVIIQLWLLAAAVDAVLGGDFDVAAPAAAASGALFLANGGLLLHLLLFDRRRRRGTGGR